ncbi:lysostaphin resistance A-like protein [Halobaculum sp. MBLA0147]|uniref:CPBP family intramembrane glutamic endopeptidase n=1 Tax=Halobaculum sp. MBLA0147 TaxID=3079934 RepID=UPI003525FC10
MFELPFVTLFGVGLAAAGHQTLSRLAARVGFETVIADDRTRSDVVKWVAAGAMLAYVLGVEGRALSSIGLRAPDALPVVGSLTPVLDVLVWSGLGVVATWVTTVAVYALYTRLGLPLLESFEDELRDGGTARYLFTVLSAGVVESLLYQGYLIERLTGLTGSVILAAGLSCVVFTAAHAAGETFSTAETVYIGVPAAVLTALYVVSGSVYVACLTHVVVNTLSAVTE